MNNQKEIIEMLEQKVKNGEMSWRDFIIEKEKLCKRKGISKSLRLQVYNKYNGHCAYCGCELELKQMQVDHLECFINNGENLDLENLMPSCRQCNYYKGTMTLEMFRNELTLLRGRLERIFIYRLSKKYGFITENDDTKIKFYYEEAKE